MHGDVIMSVTVKYISTLAFEVTETIWVAQARKKVHREYGLVLVACDLVIIVVIFREASPRRFNGVRSRDKTTFYLCKIFH